MIKFSDYSAWRIPAVVLLALAALLYWAVFSRRALHPFQAIPLQTAIVTAFQGSESLQLLEKSVDGAPENGLLGLALMQTLRRDMEAAGSFFQSDSTLRQAFRKNLLIAAASLQPSDSLHAAFALDVGNRFSLDAFLEAQSAAFRYFPAQFKGRTLFTIHLSRTERLVVASVRNLVLFSRYSYLVEDALLQVDSRGQWWMKRAYATDDAQSPPLVQVLIRTGVWADRCMGIIAPVWKNLPHWLAGQAEWLDMYWEGQNWRLIAGGGAMTHFARTGPGLSNSVFAVLPQNTALLGRMAVSNASGAGEWLSAGDFQRYISPWLGEELDFVLLEPFSPGMLEDQYWVLAMGDSLLARQSLEAFGRDKGLVKQYDYQTYEISQFLGQSLLSPLLGEVSGYIFRNPVYAVIDRFVVFAPTTSAMELWIDKYIVNQTLSNQPDLLQLYREQPGWGSAALLINTAYAPLLLKNLVEPAFYQRVAADAGKFQALGLVRLETIGPGKKDGLTAAIMTQNRQATTSETSILWKIALGGAAITQPFVVHSKDPSQETAILIQDDQFQLYRLTPSGSVVWRRQLDLPIQSEIHGIDFFNNGANCFVFNTADAIWVLDDRGKEVVGYPLKLQSMATNGISIVDFDNNRKYHFFLACANGNLYGFDQFGRPLPGWNPQSGVGRIKHSLIYFKHDTKDYLAALNLSGRLFVFNRNGSPQFAPLQFEGSFFVNPPQCDAGNQAPRIVCTNAAGRAYICNLNGQVFSMQLAGGSNREATLVLSNLTGDSRCDYAVLADASLSISGYTGAKFQQWTKERLPSPQDTLFTAGCCASLGMLNRRKRQIWLTDSQGRIHPDFPLAGTTPFILDTLFSNRIEKVLVVGNENSIYAYKIR